MLKFKKSSLFYLGVSMASLVPNVWASQSSHLDTVVVTANRHETEILQAPASISVVTQEELALKNADDLADALTSEAGITISSVGQNRQGISIRGMPVEHTLYLINGTRINSSNSVMAHSDFELNWLPTSAIERIEVVRGPMSSLYGADALGGVVNIITREPSEEFHGEISTTVSTLDQSGGDTRKTNIYLSGAIIPDKLSFSLGGELFDRNDLPNTEDSDVSDIEGRNSRSGQGELVWALDPNQEFVMSYSAGDDDRNLDISSSTGYYTSKNNVDREQYGIAYQGKWQWGHVKLNAYEANIKRKQSRSDGVDAGAAQEIKDSVVDGHVSMPLGQSHFLSLGGQLREETLHNENFINDGDASANHSNTFVQDEWDVLESLTLVGGVSLDSHDEYDNEVSPRIYAVYQLSDNISLKGGYGQGFRAPSLTELSLDYQVLAAGGRFWVEGNPDLEPERSKTYEASMEYHNQNTLVSARIFENQLDNLVQTVCYVDCGTRGSERRNYQNVDESRIQGIELVLNQSLTESINLDANYTHLKTEDLGTDKPLEDRPKHRANLTLNWSPVESTKLSWRSEYVGVQYTGTEGYVPDYLLNHLDLSFQINKYLKISSGVDNIFDERLEDKSDLYNGTEPGREIRFGISAAF